MNYIFRIRGIYSVSFEVKVPFRQGTGRYRRQQGKKPPVFFIKAYSHEQALIPIINIEPQ